MRSMGNLAVLAAVSVALSGPAFALDWPTLHAALATGDTAAMVEVVADIYADAGASRYDTLSWRFEAYDYTFNYFDPYEDLIVLGSMPDATEVDAYWANWSRTLTGGKWQADAFFADADAARDQARFNQFVIALHEMGHALTYRYDYDHLKRHDYAVNCREYYADRLAMAALADLAAADPAIAALRQGYVALMASMNAAIAGTDRYHIASYEALDADCALIDVAQPTPETLQPYASAYFERLRLLAGAPLPPLRDVVATHLEARRAAFMAEMPYIATSPGYTLTTLKTLEDTRPVDLFVDLSDAYALGFDLAGALHIAQLAYDDTARSVTISYGPEGALRRVVDSHPYPVEVDALRLVDIVALSHDWLLALVAEEHGARQDFALYEIKPRGEGWDFALMDRVEGMALARLMQAPDGRLALLASSDGQRFGYNSGWVSVEFTLEGDVRPGRAYQGIYGVPIAIEADGDLVTAGFDLLFSFNAEGQFDVIAGNHLEGLKDGTRPEATELIDPVFGQVLPDGTLRFIDGATEPTSLSVRELSYGGAGG